MKRGDRLVSIDGQSLRYLSLEIVSSKMTTPHFTSFHLEYERDCFVRRGGRTAKDLGLRLRIVYRGPVIEKIEPQSSAAQAGLQENDLLVAVSGSATRYLDLGQIMKKIDDTQTDPVAFTVRRSSFLTRR